jgi:hypothetical protein
MPDDRGFKKAFGDQSADPEVSHEGAPVDETSHGWAPDADEGTTPGSEQRVVDANLQAFKAEKGTAPTSSGENPTEDPSAATKAGDSMTRRGEDVIKQEGQEAGRVDLGTKGESQRPYGTVESGEGAGVKPSEPIDPSMPAQQTGDQGG